MTIQEIKDAVDAGKTVHWSGNIYDVIKDHRNGTYLILCKPNLSCIGLISLDGTRLNGDEQDFYIS